MQQALSSRDVLVHGHRLSGHTACSTAPPGAKFSDVQFGRHVDLCQKLKMESGKLFSIDGARCVWCVCVLVWVWFVCVWFVFFFFFEIVFSF